MPEQPPQGEPPQKSIYMPYGASGGGGEGGTYVFTDLDHLDRVIGKWTTIRDDVFADGNTIADAIRQIVPPASDKPSVTQASAAGSSLTRGQQHNQAMLAYMDGFIGKLQTTRTQYATTEQNNADTMRNVDNR